MVKKISQISFICETSRKSLLLSSEFRINFSLRDFTKYNDPQAIQLKIKPNQEKKEEANPKIIYCWNELIRSLCSYSTIESLSKDQRLPTFFRF